MDAIKLYRIGNWCYKKKLPVIPNIIHKLIFLVFNSHIPSSCTIGKETRLGYGGIATVLHSNCIIGDNCIIGSGVTIGGNKANESVPIIENRCYIATGAKIFGEITIGEGSFIGANSVVTKDIPPKSLVAGIPGKIIKENININDYSVYIK